MTAGGPGLLQRFGAQPLRRQMIVLVVCAQVVAHVSTIMIVSNALLSSNRIDKIWVELSDALITAITVLDSGADQGAVIDALIARDERFSLREADFNAPPVNVRITSAIHAELPVAWRGRVNVHDFEGDKARFSGAPDRDPFVILTQMPEGQVLLFVPNSGVVSRNAPSVAATLTVVFLAVPLAVLAVWSGALILRPVERLSAAAERFSVDARTELLSETGAEEVRSAIRSFNNMQERLRSMIDDRAQTLASIGHDLRTPLTRLSLRLEAIDLGTAEEGVRRDIGEMRQMIDDALAFLSAESKPVTITTVDLSSLCETAVTDFVDQGKEVTLCQDAETITANCDISLTMRALTNLIDNGLKYAGAVDVRVSSRKQDVVITVADRGPGIPAELMALASKPFNRLEATTAGQSHVPSGFGLGLAIAEDCMRRQGGSLTLEKNAPQGLIATLSLPA